MYYPLITDKGWEVFGYPTSEPCDICGNISEGGNKGEPRFSYPTCKDHANVPPVMRTRFKEQLQCVMRLREERDEARAQEGK